MHHIFYLGFRVGDTIFSYLTSASHMQQEQQRLLGPLPLVSDDLFYDSGLLDTQVSNII